MGWGTSPWGLGSWGLGPSSAAGGVALCYAAANRLVRVTLGQPPLASNSAVLGDATNPNSWIVYRLETAIPVLSVDQVDASTFDLHLLEKLGELVVQHTVDAGLVLTPEFLPLPPPTRYAFQGLISNTEINDTARQAAKRAVSTDLANSPFPVSPHPGGTLEIGASGDYQNVTGAALVRKLIYRRLTTLRGRFFHLPKYGFGRQAKRSYAPSELPALQSEFQNDVLLEREVEDAQVVIIGNPADGFLTVNCKVMLVSMPDPISFSFQLPGAVIA